MAFQLADEDVRYIIERIAEVTALDAAATPASDTVGDSTPPTTASGSGEAPSSDAPAPAEPTTDAAPVA